MDDKETQREAFERVARELECDDDEDRFNARVKKIATGTKPKDDKPSK